jgi:peptidoglycan hydrolase-like protein with peptidoglycan-binding domain
MAKPDPAVIKIQQDLIAQGAKIKADGVMGPATQAAMKQFPGVSGISAAKPAAVPAAYNAARDSQAANTAPAAKPASTAPTTFAQDTAARKQALTPAQLAGKKPAAESVQARDDQILAIIKGIRVG